MKIPKSDNYMHILDAHTTSWNVLREISNSNEQKDPFYVCNISDIFYKFERWNTFLPRVEPFYAVKCNNNVAVLEVLAALGTGFSCSSKAEINQISSINVSSDRIVFTNPTKLASHIKHADNSDVSFITFDSATELYKVKRLCPKANLVIRIRCEAEDARYPLGMFGCNSSSEAPELLKIAHSLDLQVVGVSVCTESDFIEPNAYSRAIEAARDLFNYASTLNYDFNLLDLGEGFPEDHHATSLNKIAEEINSALDLHFPNTSVRVIAAPSRFFVSSALILACNIHSIRSVDKVDPVTSDYHPHRMYFINDGVYGSFSCILYDHQCPKPLPLNEQPMSKMYSSSIWGPTCDGLDQVIEEIILPEMNVGDWLIFENMGAYTLPVSSPFNGFPVPKVHIMAHESTWENLKNIVSLGEDSFIMGSSPEVVNYKKNSSESTRHAHSMDISFENDIFYLSHFELSE